MQITFKKVLLKLTKLSRIEGYGGRRIKKVAKKKKIRHAWVYKNLDFSLKKSRNGKFLGFWHHWLELVIKPVVLWRKVSYR